MLLIIQVIRLTEKSQEQEHDEKTTHNKALKPLTKAQKSEFPRQSQIGIPEKRSPNKFVGLK